jgi:hypothetical protein
MSKHGGFVWTILVVSAFSIAALIICRKKIKPIIDIDFI